MSRALTVQPDGTIEIHDLAAIDYDWLRAQVGGTIYPIDLEEDEPPTFASMYAHDEGKLIGLPRNRVAERLAHHYGAIYADDWIAGPAVIVGLSPSGNSCGLTAAFVAQALRVMTGEVGCVQPIRVAPTYWQEIAKAVYAGVPVVAVGGPEAFPPPSEETRP